MVDELFSIDAEARNSSLDRCARNFLRLERFRSVFDIITDSGGGRTVRSAAFQCSGQGDRYALSLWHKVTRCPEHPNLELSNNLAENSVSVVVPGRKHDPRW